MKCVICGSRMMKERSKLYHYVFGGLSKVYLKGIQYNRCTSKSCGELEISIPNLEELHVLLSMKIASQDQALLPEEIRFLRTQLGFSGVDFAKVMGVTPETVSRWENGSVSMKEASERLLRVLILTQTGPFRDYDNLKGYATISARVPKRRVFEIEKSHWSESEVA